MIYPHPLRAGARVAVVAPSSAFSRPAFEAGVELVRQAGFEPHYDPSIFARHHYLAGDDAHRLQALLSALESPEVDAIFCARGGYGATRLLKGLAPEQVQRSPKWLVGFSDATALHALWRRADVVSLHGPNMTTLPHWETAARDELWSVLMADAPHALVWQGEEVLADGVECATVEGTVVGGNLTVLAALAGTGFLPSWRDCIVVLEDVGERPYRLDRALVQLQQVGAFEGVRGLVLGHFLGCTETRAPDDQDQEPARQALLDALGQPAFPVLLGVPVGHHAASRCLPFGARAEIDLASACLRMQWRVGA